MFLMMMMMMMTRLFVCLSVVSAKGVHPIRGTKRDV